jgi:hypothetical protein
VHDGKKSLGRRHYDPSSGPWYSNVVPIISGVCVKVK